MSKNHIGKNNKVFLRIAVCFVFAAFLLQPVAALAEIKLENFYPDIAGIKSITGKEIKLGDIVKYYSQWALIIAILVCVVSIIWAGTNYVASSGQPNVMRQARERITNSFIGLAILVSSYLILNTLNPQFVLTKVLKTSIPKTGIVLLTKTGYSALSTGQGVDDLVAAGSARWLNYDIAKGEAEFGPLVNYNNSASDNAGNPILCSPQAYPCDFNFLRFPIYGLGFLSGSEEDYKVAIFNNTNFLGTKLMYKAEGQWDEQNDKLVAGKESTSLSSGIKVIIIDKVLTKSPVDYWGNAKDSAPVSDEELAKIISKSKTDPKIKIFTRDGAVSFVPPLSIKLSSEAPGVYLYSDNDPSKGEMRYFSSSVDRLVRDDVKFDNKAMAIRIKNTSPSGDVQHQFLAILYSLSDFTGQARIFFSASDKDKINLSSDDALNSIPYLYASDDYKSGTANFPVLLDNARKTSDGFFYNKIFSNVEPFDPPKLDPFKSAKFRTFSEGLNKLTNKTGNQLVEEVKNRLTLGQKDIGDKAIKIYNDYGADMYGSISPDDKVSSVHVFELNENPIACERVKFCRKASGTVCFEFRPVSSAVFEPVHTGGSIILPMPYYTTVNVPKMAFYGFRSVAQTWVMESQIADFNDTIDTIEMSGKCLVVLFEKKAVFGNTEGKFDFAGWEDGQTGQRTTTLDYTQGNLIDLATKQIHLCGFVVGWNKKHGDSCLSSVAVFSIK